MTKQFLAFYIITLKTLFQFPRRVTSTGPAGLLYTLAWDEAGPGHAFCLTLTWWLLLYHDDKKDNHVSIKVSCFCASSHHKTQKCFGKSQTNDFVLPTEARTREHFCTSFQKGTKHFVLIWRIYCSYSNHWISLRRGRQFKSLRLSDQRTCLLCLEAQMTFCVLRWFRSIWVLTQSKS